jgi:hypothetical protein
VPAARNRLAAVTLTITGSNLGNGSDITSVTVCSTTAAIVSQSTGSITVDHTGTGAVTSCTVATWSESFGLAAAPASYEQLPGTRGAVSDVL